MKATLILVFSLCLGGYVPHAEAQTKKSANVKSNKIQTDKFDFVNKWAYAYNIIKHENGQFENINGGRIEAKDTARLYFTSNCKTNVQGGYAIRYCYAVKKDRKFELNFMDGQPAYFNEFHITITDNKNHFEPRLVSEELIPGEQTIYKTNKCQLTLTPGDLTTDKMVSGYINVEFEQTIKQPQKQNITNKYYLRGYFKTPIKST